MTRKDWDLELFGSLFAVFVAVAAVYDISTGGRLKTMFGLTAITFTSEIVLWGGSHALGSYFVFFTTPEYRELRQAHKNQRISAFVLSVLVYIGFAAVTLLLTVLGTQMPAWSRACFFVVALLVSLSASRHVIKQTFGLSLLFGQSIAREIGSEKLALIRRRDGQTFTLLTGLIFVGLTLGYWNFYWPEKSVPRTIFAVLILGLAGVTTRFIYHSWRDRHLVGHRKVIFSLRTLLYPLTFLSPLGQFGMVSMHGIEHLTFSRRMLKQSRARSIRLSVTYILFVIGLMIIHGGLRLRLLDIIDPPSRFPANLPLVTLILFSVTNAIGPAHYVLDWYMFRMRDEATRKSIGPLLLPIHD